MRTCGILYPVFSLPSRFGIGCFSKEALEFIDFLKQSGQGAWQILPLGPTGFGDSPYQPVSVFAGNPYFISLEDLINEGLLHWHEAEQRDFGSDPETVDYGALYNNRYAVLKTAYERFRQRNGFLSAEYRKFSEKEAYWLDDYALFMAVKAAMKNRNWLEWDEPLKTREKAALEKIRREEADMIGFHKFMQFKFMEQWDKVHRYAEKNNIRIIGDMPFYVALDSSDVWAHPEMFLMDKKKNPSYVAGCAPDEQNKTGQLWGNPVYDWKHMAKDHYDWWMKRIRRNQELFDVIRIDHFHGFCDYYAVPYGDKTAENGKKEKGPGLAFFKEMEKQLGKVDLIAEDLGTVTKENAELLEKTAIPGMEILQYAFTSWNSIYITHRHKPDKVVYTGTHDTMPTRAWVETLNEGQMEFARKYINSIYTDYGTFVWDFIREAYRSVSDLCIIPLQDYLVKGAESRINTPGAAGENWKWRVLPGFLSKELSLSIRRLSEIYGRIPEAKTERKKEEKD